MTTMRHVHSRQSPNNNHHSSSRTSSTSSISTLSASADAAVSNRGEQGADGSTAQKLGGGVGGGILAEGGNNDASKASSSSAQHPTQRKRAQHHNLAVDVTGPPQDGRRGGRNRERRGWSPKNRLKKGMKKIMDVGGGGGGSHGKNSNDSKGSSSSPRFVEPFERLRQQAAAGVGNVGDVFRPRQLGQKAKAGTDAAAAAAAVTSAVASGPGVVNVTAAAAAAAAAASAVPPGRPFSDARFHRKATSFDCSVIDHERSYANLNVPTVVGADRATEIAPPITLAARSFDQQERAVRPSSKGGNNTTHGASDDRDADDLNYDARVRFNLGEINLTNGQFGKAWDNVRRSLDARMSLHGPDHESVAEAHEKLGDIAVAARMPSSDVHNHYDAAMKILRNLCMCGDRSQSAAATDYGEGEDGVPRSASGELDRRQQASRLNGTRRPNGAYCRLLLKKASAYAASRETYEAFYAYSQALAVAKTVEGERGRGVTDILIKLGYMQVELGDEDAALRFFDEAAANHEAEPTGHDFSTIYYVKGLICERTARYDRALEEYAEALSMRRSQLGRAHPSVCAVLRHVGLVQFRRGEYDEAIASYMEALAIMKEMEFDFPSALEVVESLVAIHKRRRDLDSALECYRKTMAVTKLGIAETCPEVATLWGRVADLYLDFGRDVDAVRALKKEGKVRLQLQDGDDNGHVVVRLLLKIGTICRMAGRDDEALQYYEEAVDMLVPPPPQLDDRGREDRHVTLGELVTYSLEETLTLDEKLSRCEHALHDRGRRGGESTMLSPHEFADEVNDMGNLYLGRRSYTEAIACYRSVVRIKSSEAVCDEEEVWRVEYNLGVALFRGDFYQEATETFEGLLHRQEQVYRDECVEIANTLNQLGNVHLVTGDCLEAITCYKRALRIKREKLGFDDVEVLGTMRNLGSAFLRIGTYDRALVHFEEVLRIQRVGRNEDDVEIAPTLVMIGSVHIKTGNFRKAFECMEQALRLREDKLGKDDPLVGRTLSEMAGLHLARRDFAKSKTRCQDALVIFKRAKLTPDHPYMQDVKKRIIKLEHALVREQESRAGGDRSRAQSACLLAI